MTRSKACILLVSLAVVSLRSFGESDESIPAASAGKETPTERKTDEPLYAKERMILLSFDGADPPRNGDGDGYPNQYPYNPVRKEGGTAVVSTENKDAISGASLRVELTKGKLYLQFNPWNYAGNSAFPSGPRSFARAYVQNPNSWKLNTYNRMRFWIKVPKNAQPHLVNGQTNVEFGTYVRQVKDVDVRSDEAGGGHYYHCLNIPALGEWTQVVLNMHPDHRRGESGGSDPGVLNHPTNEANYNYFDTLTRFYIQYPYHAPKTYPTTFLLDDIEFFQEPREENDDQVYSLTATYGAQENRLVVTWNRRKAEDKISHEVRYAFSDIHASGWPSAKPAPKGTITPPGEGGYNCMLYNTTALPLKGRTVLYLAIKPKNSDRFSQIVVPLSKKHGFSSVHGRG